MDVPFELRVLRSFVAVAEELHFGRAAARLFISQPSLSVQMQKLEKKLGVPLLVRNSRSVQLTDAGAVLLEEAHSLLAAADRAFSLTQRVGSQHNASPIAVGFQANAAAELTPYIFSQFAKRYPGCRTEMKSFDLTDPYVGLSDGSVDVAFIRVASQVPAWLEMEMLYLEPRVLAVSTTSPFAGNDTVSIEQLVDSAFVARKGPDSWRDYWLATEARGGYPVRVGAEISQLEECLEAVISGRAIGFTQASTARYYARPGLTTVPVIGVPPSGLAIAWQRGDMSDSVRAFVETARFVAQTNLVPSALPLAGMN